MDLLKDGKISLDEASEIAGRKTIHRIVLSKTTEKRRKDFFNIKNENRNIKHMVFDKLVSENSNTAV